MQYSIIIIPCIYKNATDLAISWPLADTEMQAISELLLIKEAMMWRVDRSTSRVVIVLKETFLALRNLAAVPSTSHVRIQGASTVQVKRTWLFR